MIRLSPSVAICEIAQVLVSRLTVVGAGQGLIMAELRKNGFRSEGIDLSSEVIRYAKTRRGLTFVQADARAMPFGEGTYRTIIYTTGVVDFIEEENRSE